MVWVHIMTRRLLVWCAVTNLRKYAVCCCEHQSSLRSIQKAYTTGWGSRDKRASAVVSLLGRSGHKKEREKEKSKPVSTNIQLSLCVHRNFIVRLNVCTTIFSSLSLFYVRTACEITSVAPSTLHPLSFPSSDAESTPILSLPAFWNGGQAVTRCCFPLTVCCTCHPVSISFFFFFSSFTSVTSMFLSDIQVAVPTSFEPLLRGTESLSSVLSLGGCTSYVHCADKH